MVPLRVRVRATAKSHQLIMEFDFDKNVGQQDKKKIEDFGDYFTIVNNGQLKVNKRSIEAYFKREGDYHITELKKLHKKCLPTYLIVNNGKLTVSDIVLNYIKKEASSMQQKLKTRIMTVNPTGALIGLAQSKASEMPQAPEDIAFKHTVNKALDRIVKLIDHKYFTTMRDINMNMYNQIKVLGYQKVLAQIGVAQKIQASPLSHVLNEVTNLKSMKSSKSFAAIMLLSRKARITKRCFLQA